MRGLRIEGAYSNDDRGFAKIVADYPKTDTFPICQGSHRVDSARRIESRSPEPGVRGSRRSWLLVLVIRISRPFCAHICVSLKWLCAKVEENRSGRFLQAINKTWMYMNSNIPPRGPVLSWGTDLTKSSHCAHTHPSSIVSPSCFLQW